MKRSPRPLARLIFTCLALFTLAAAPLARPAATWHVLPVQPSGVAGGAAIAVDAAGLPHLSFVTTSGEVRYAAWVAGSWQTAPVGHGTGVTALEFDGQGAPHVAYTAAGLVAYATPSASGWLTETVTTDGLTYTSLSLDFDPAGNPHLCYSLEVTGAQGRLGYAHRSGGAWQAADLATPFEGGAGCAIAIDRGGRPHIAYVGVIGALSMKHWNGAAWIDELVDTSTTRRVSLALDGDDQPHFASVAEDGGAYNVQYGQRSGSGWAIDPLAPAAGQQAAISLALTAAGLPRLAYSETTNPTLHYAAFDGQEWHSEPVGAPGSAGPSVSLALDASQWPHVAYLDAAGALQYASPTALPTPNRSLFLLLLARRR